MTQAQRRVFRKKSHHEGHKKQAERTTIPHGTEKYLAGMTRDEAIECNRRIDIVNHISKTHPIPHIPISSH